MPQTQQRTIIAILCLCAAALVFTSPILVPLGNWGILDWDFQFYHHGVPRLTLLEYGEFPLWNPFNQSGVPMLAHPESPLLTPTFVAVLLFGEVIGLKLEVVFHLLAAVVGAFLLLRTRGLDEVASFAGACVFGFNSFFALHITVGHVWALSFAWLPWLLLAYDRSVDQPRWTLAASGLLVMTFLAGAPYPFMINSLFLGLYAISRAVGDRRIRLHAALMGGIVLQVSLLAAVKLVPTVELMSQFPRTTPPESGFSLAAFRNALLDPDQTIMAAYTDRPAEFNGTPVHEGMYIGLIATFLFIVGIFTRARKHLGLLIIGLVFFWISMGQHAPIDLWAWLHRLPAFDNMRMVQRFSIVGVLVVSVFAGFGVAELGRQHRFAALGAAALLCVELFVVNRPILQDAFVIPPLEVQGRDTFEQTRGLSAYDAKGWVVDRSPYGLPALTSLYPSVLALRGSTIGYPILPVESHGVASDAPAYRGEAHRTSGAPVHYSHWSPNRLGLEVEGGAVAGETLVINQNYQPGWTARTPEGSRAVAPYEGLIGVALEPGDADLELRFRPDGVMMGACVSLAGAVAIAAWGLWPLVVRSRRPVA